MVRINLINPKYLADQHLIAEYNEILKLFGYAKKHPKTDLKEIPKDYKLGKGHILFFKNKLKYLIERHKLIKIEMQKRKFNPVKKIKIIGINKELIKDWKPKKENKNLIKKRLIEKIKLKPNFYRYYGNNKKINFFINLIKNAR